MTFDADAFAKRHSGRKESRSHLAREYLFRCPAADCGSSRLRWNCQKQTWICWGCHRTGDTIKLISFLEKCSEEDAIDYVLKRYVGGDAPTSLDEIQPSAIASTPKVHLQRLPQIPWPAGVELITDVPMHERARAYLAYRGITPEQTARYRIGFGRSGRLANYIVFPMYQDDGLVFWQGRATWDPPVGLSSEDRKKWIKDTHYIKTLNPSGISGSEVIFNLDRVSVDSVVICEGPIDAIKVGPHAVALLGKVASPAKIERLRRLRTQRYVVYLDSGEEELKAAIEIAQQLMAYAPTFIVQPPPGYDPGSLTPEQNQAILASAQPVRTWQLGHLKT